jgi:hypothetical protein
MEANMAKNYTQFSQVISNLTDEEVGWLERQLETVYVFDDTEYTEEKLPDGADPSKADWHGCRALRDIDDRENVDDEGLGFEWDMHEGENEYWGRHLSIYANGSDWAEPVAHFVQKFLKTHRPNECLGLPYGIYCSSPCAGEYGGGAVFVTADAIKWQDSYSFIENEKKRFEEERSLANAS